jgi:anti-sigma factor RsiW
MPHETPETLSSLIDGELSADDAARARAHAASCPDCKAILSRFEGASAAFKRSGEHVLPVGLAARAKAHAAPRRAWPVRLGLAAAFGVVLLLLSGAVVKSLLPTLFNNIQQMITGAAGQMGTGGK